jgi:3-hydroxyacyl-[acyl-carrier-protein] dehydratase
MELDLATPIDVQRVMTVLPHRYPMLLIDRITHLTPMRRATGYKNLTVNEEFFQGHFPGTPMMPGVLMIEALAQLGGTIILTPADFERRTAVLTGINRAKFRRPAVPGDRLDMEVILVRMRSNMGYVEAETKVDGKLVCSAELMFAVIDHPKATSLDASVLHE